MQKQRILVVDDEEDLCEILKFNLENEGYLVDVAYSGEQALDTLVKEHALVLLDVMMDGLSGFQTADKIRKEKKLQVPIVFLTAKNTENDVLTGFSLGADDYISKPFSVKEVIARVYSVLRRSSVSKSETKETDVSETLSCGGLKLDIIKKEVSLEGQTVKLTKKEFELLMLFMRFPNRVFSREELLSKVWPEDGCVLDRTVDVHIARLRKKIDVYGNRILNRSGYGYYFETNA